MLKNGSRIGSQKVQESWGWGMQYIEQLTQDQRFLQHSLGLFPKEKDSKWYDMTEKIEAVTKRIMYQTKKMLIYPNVDLYSASLYYTLGDTY